MGDNYTYFLNLFYWRGDGKIMFLHIVEVTTFKLAALL